MMRKSSQRLKGRCLFQFFHLFQQCFQFLFSKPLPTDSESRTEDNPLENLPNLASSLVTDESAPQEEKVKIYWKSLSPEKKQDFLQVSIDNLSDFSNMMEENLLSEALAYYQLHKQWKCWICCDCSRKFTNSESHFQHVLRAHLKTTLPRLVDPDWVSIINNGNWEPADASLTLPILLKLMKSVSESRNNREPFSEFDLKAYFFCRSWPLSANPDRAKILKKIQIALQRTLSDQLLLEVHVSYLARQTVKKLSIGFNKLQNEFAGNWLLDIGLDKTHLCICLLEVSELKCILYLSNRIFESSSKILKEIEALDGISNIFTPDFKSKVNIVLQDKFLYVLFNEPGESTSDPKATALLSWICSDASSEHNLESWTNLRQERGKKELDKFKITQQKGKAESSSIQTNWVKSIRQVPEDTHHFGFKINSIAAVDYCEVLLFLCMRYIKVQLEATASNEITHMSDDEATDKPDGGDGGASQV